MKPKPFIASLRVTKPRLNALAALCCLLFYALSSDANAAERKTVLFLGDSLTAGFGIDVDQAYPALIQEKIDAAGLEWKAIAAGLSGDTSAGGLRRLDWVMRQPVDALVIALGANDGLRGVDLASTRSNLQGIIDKAKANNPRIQIVVVGMQLPPNLGSEYTGEFRELFQELAEKNGAALVPFLLEGVGGVPELNLPDRLHPNPAGHKILAENVWAVLEPVLRKD